MKTLLFLSFTVLTLVSTSYAANEESLKIRSIPQSWLPWYEESGSPASEWWNKKAIPFFQKRRSIDAVEKRISSLLEKLSKKTKISREASKIPYFFQRETSSSDDFPFFQKKVADRKFPFFQREAEANDIPYFQREAKNIPYFQREAKNIPYFQREAKNIPYFQREAKNIPYFQRDAKNIPYFQREAKNIPYFQREANNIPYFQRETETDHIPYFQREIASKMIPYFQREASASDIPFFQREVEAKIPFFNKRNIPYFQREKSEVKEASSKGIPYFQREASSIPFFQRSADNTIPYFNRDSKKRSIRPSRSWFNNRWGKEYGNHIPKESSSDASILNTNAISEEKIDNLASYLLPWFKERYGNQMKGMLKRAEKPWMNNRWGKDVSEKKENGEKEKKKVEKKIVNELNEIKSNEKKNIAL